jgi:hypothetical protein
MDKTEKAVTLINEIPKIPVYQASILKWVGAFCFYKG